MVLRLNLPSDRTRPWLLALALVNLALTALTAAFIHAWARLDAYSPAARSFVEAILVHGHLATENNFAAWYSSMLLLSVAAAACLAYVVDRRAPPGRRSQDFAAGWLIIGATFLLLSLDELGSLHERLGMLSSLNIRGTGAPGWVTLLAIPIAIVGVFLFAFAWLHVRRHAAAFRLMAIGTALFLSNPLLEQVEMSLILGSGAEPGTTARALHDVLVVLEEGFGELFGAWCFLSACVTYAQRRAGTGTLTLAVDGVSARYATLAASIALAAAVPVAHGMSARLPAGDIGRPDNWFPAAAALACAGVLLAVLAPLSHGRLAKDPTRLAVISVVLSAYFGSGLYEPSGWVRLDLVHRGLGICLGAAFLLLAARLSLHGRRDGRWLMRSGGGLMACSLLLAAPLAPLLATVAAGCVIAGILELASSATPPDAGRLGPPAPAARRTRAPLLP